MGRRPSGEMPRVTVVRPRNHARVRIGGKAHWLGKCPHGRVTASQQAEAARLWHEYLNNLPLQPFFVEPEQSVEEGLSATATPRCLTVAGLMVAYLDHADTYYRRADGSKTSSIDGVRMAARAVIPWSNVPAVAFGPRLLKDLMAAEVRAGRPRITVNRIAKLIRSAFKWAAGEELVAVEAWQGLQAVSPLKKGRTTAAEIPPVEEVPEAIVTETLAVLPRVVAAMVEFQRWTGARPGEVCLIRPCDIDQSREVWEYRPSRHKTDWRDEAGQRVIAIGPQAQRVLRPFLARGAEKYCFSPKESEADRAAMRRAACQSRLSRFPHREGVQQCGQRRPGERYDTASYRRAIQRAIDKANKAREASGQPPLPGWAPNQLRHLRAGELEQMLGLEAANAVLGHQKVETTQIYARRKRLIARDAAQRTG